MMGLLSFAGLESGYNQSFRLISEANVKYGEYKSLLNTLEFDASFFLDSVLLTESYKSTQIEGTQISQDEMYYLKYLENTDDNREIQNLKKTIEYASEHLNSNKFINYELVNVALSHMQFETIHAYKDGNGRQGRALIPVQMSLLDDSTPMLYMSEILELYKPAYQRNLMECRKGNVAGYIKFFLQCVIDQCNAYIYKLEKIKEIYKEDMKAIQAIKGNSVYRIMPVIMKQIVFTKKRYRHCPVYQ